MTTSDLKPTESRTRDELKEMGYSKLLEGALPYDWTQMCEAAGIPTFLSDSGVGRNLRWVPRWVVVMQRKTAVVLQSKGTLQLQQKDQLATLLKQLYWKNGKAIEAAMQLGAEDNELYEFLKMTSAGHPAWRYL